METYPHNVISWHDQAKQAGDAPVLFVMQPVVAATFQPSLSQLGEMQQH